MARPDKVRRFPNDADADAASGVNRVGTASSNIFHLPGSRFYDMTTPERCYRDGEAAEADGVHAPKR